MIVYILNIIISVSFATLAVRKGTKRTNALGEEYIEPNHYLLFLMFVSILFVYAARGWTGTDSGLYRSQFYSITNRDLKTIIKTDRDWLFSVVVYLDYKLFGSLFWHNVVVGLLLYVPIIKIYKEYTDNFPMALFLYIVTCAYYFGFNGQRQGIAISITLLGYPYLMQKKFLSWIIICIIASFFHTTAYLMIPIGFLLTMDTESRMFVVATVTTFVCAILIWSLWDQLFSLLDAMGQKKIVNDYSRMNSSNSHGANPIRILISSVPILLGIFYYKTLKSPRYCIALNASIWLLLFAVASTRNVFFYRCSAYFAPIQIFMFFEIEKMFDDKSKRFYWIALSVLYLAYMWVSLHSEGEMIPYKLFFKHWIY